MFSELDFDILELTLDLIKNINYNNFSKRAHCNAKCLCLQHLFLKINSIVMGFFFSMIYDRVIID